MTVQRKKNTTINVFDDSVLLFPLGKLGGYKSQGFCDVGEHLDGDRFVLTLAHAYNDLKDLFLWWEINREMAPSQPPAGKLDKRFGQSCGIDSHVFRLMSGWLVEARVLLRSQKIVIENGLFADTIAKLDEKAMTSWRSLCEFSWSDDATLNKNLTELRTYLVKVRSDGTFHYEYVKPLAQGFVSHFADPSKPESSYAFATYGKNLEESRFLFGDAAITAMCGNMADGQLVKFQNTLTAYLRDSHFSFRAVVKKYMAKRGFAYHCLES